MKQIILFWLTLHIAHSVSAGISLSSMDNFSSSSEGWSIGGAGVQPSHNGGNGQDGNPGFLSHFSDGGGANGKWLMFTSQSDWTGDYIAAGVSGISLWAEVTAGSNLGLRIGFDGPGGWFYSEGQTVDAGWSQFIYLLTPDQFTYAAGSGGTASFNDTMSGVTRFEIFGGSGAVSYRSNGDLLQAGTSIATLSIDNIQVVPEPSAAALLLAAGVIATRTLLRRRA
jgi:hypothetical protein